MISKYQILPCAVLLVLSGCAVGRGPAPRVPDGISALPVSFDEQLPDECGIDEALSIAWYRHPAMKRAQHLVSARYGEQVQAGLWPRPNVGVFSMDKPVETEIGVVLAQKFELGGKRKARVTESAAKVFLAETEMMSEWTAIQAGVKLAFARLAFVRQSLDLHKQVLDLDAEYARLSASFHKAGKLAETKLVEAKQRESLAKSVVIKQQAQLKDATRDVLLTLGIVHAEKPITFEAVLVVPAVPDDYEELLKGAVKGSSKVAIAKVEAEVARAAHTVARAARMMDATVGFTFKDISRDDDNGGSAVGAQLSLDLPLWNRGQGNAAAADSRARASESGEEAARLDVARALSGLLAEYKTWQSKSNAYAKEIVPLDERRHGLVESSFKSGRASALDLVESKLQLKTRQLEHLQARLMLSVAGVELERITLSCLPQD